MTKTTSAFAGTADGMTATMAACHPKHEAVYQCPMYMHYHPEEVKQFEEEYKKWAEAKYGKLKED